MNVQARWTRGATLAGLLLAVLAAYAGAITNGFLYDDYHLIAENPAVFTHDWGAVWTSGDAASRDIAGRGFRPATLSSYLLDHAVGSGRPLVYHATQVGLHAMVVGLVYLVAAGVGFRLPWAAAAGLLMGLHPVQVEAVHYLSARSSILSTLWLLAAMWSYLRGRDRSDVRNRWLAASVACLALAVWSKESAVVGIVWFVAYERVVACATWGEVARRVWLHAAVGALSVLPAIVVLRGGGGGALVEAGTATATGVRAIGRHVWAMLVPMTLGPVSPQPWVGWAQPEVWASAALVLAVCAAGYAFRNRSPRFAWGVVCGVSGLLPVLALPFVTNVGLVQPHRGYQAMAGFALAIAACLEAVAERFRSLARSTAGRRALRNALLALAGACAVGLIAADVSAGRVWRDEVGFWTRAVEQYPDEAGYHQSLGAARLRAGDMPGALDALTRAATLDPALPRVSYNLGLVYAKLGRIDEAIAAYQRAVSSDASDVKALANLGWLFEKRGDRDRALASYRAALRVAPDLARVRARVVALDAAMSAHEAGSSNGDEGPRP